MRILACVLAFALSGVIPAAAQQAKKATCDTDVPGCGITCDGDCCVAICFHDTGKCVKNCCEDDIRETLRNLKIKPSSRVSMCAKNVKLAKLAIMLDALLPGKNISIAVKRMDEPVSLDVKNAGLERILKLLKLGTDREKN